MLLSVWLPAALREFEARRDGGRAGARSALRSVINFLARQELASERLLWPLNALYYALLDLDDGVDTPMLARARRRAAGRPPLPHQVEAVRLQGAVALECLIRSGMHEQPASELVSRRIKRQRLEVSTKGGEFTAQTVRSWHDAISVGATSGEKVNPTALAYKEWIRRLDGPDVDWRDAAERVLAYPVGQPPRETD